MHPKGLFLLIVITNALKSEVVAECEYNSTDEDQTFRVNVSASESGSGTIQSPCFPEAFIPWINPTLWYIRNQDDGCGLGFTSLYLSLGYQNRVNYREQLTLELSPAYDGVPDSAIFSGVDQKTSLLLDNRIMFYMFLDIPTASLAWYWDNLEWTPSGLTVENTAFQIEVKSACEKNVTCDDDQPCGPWGTCSQLNQGYSCRCAIGYGGINCSDDSRINQVSLVKGQTTILNSPGYLIKLGNAEQHVWRVAGEPGCGIGMLALEFQLLASHLNIRSSPLEDAFMSFEGSPRPYAYVEHSVVWLEFWTDYHSWWRDGPHGFSLELTIQCYNMSSDTCHGVNPCGHRSYCSVLEGGYYCLCDTWYTGVNCMEERRPVVVRVPSSVDEMAVLSPGLDYPSNTDFLWRIDAEVGCSIGAYFQEMRIIPYHEVLTVLLDPPSVRRIFTLFSSNDLAYFFVELSHVWLQFRSSLHEEDRSLQFVMHIQCQRDVEMTRCENEWPCNTESTCSTRSLGYVCTCPPGYTGINCDDDTYVTHLYLSKDEDRHLQHFAMEGRNTVRNIWHVHGTPHCAIGVSTNDHDIGSLGSTLRFLWGFDTDTTFSLIQNRNLDTIYMYLVRSGFVMQTDFRTVMTGHSQFELHMETRCDEVVLSCEDSPCSPGSYCMDKSYGFLCTCFPGFTGINCSIGNHVHHVDLEFDHQMVLDLPEYFGSPRPYPQTSWYIQGIENYTIGVTTHEVSSSHFYSHLTLTAERGQPGFLAASTHLFFISVQQASVWLLCIEHDCTWYGSPVMELSIQPTEDLSLDPCADAGCSFASECQSLDVGYVCYCQPGFHGVQCKNDSDVQKVFVDSNDLVTIPFPYPPTSPKARTTTYIQTSPGCGIGIIRNTVLFTPTVSLTFRTEVSGDVLLMIEKEVFYDRYIFFDHPEIWMETHDKLDNGQNFIVNVTSQCNEGSMSYCSRDTCEHGSLCHLIEGGGYICQCQTGFAGIRCTDEFVVSHIEVNNSSPGTLHFMPVEYGYTYQACRVVVTPGCGIGIDFRRLALHPMERFTIKDNLTMPSINQSYIWTTLTDLYIYVPRHILWFQYLGHISSHFPVHILVHESCVRGGCSLGLCESESVCEDFYDGYSCACLPGYGGVNCAEDISVRKWVLSPSQELIVDYSLEENITCVVEVPEQGCGMEFFLVHSRVIMEGPLYLRLIIQSSPASSTLLTVSKGQYNEYAYFNLSTVWFQLYTPFDQGIPRAEVRMLANCNSSLIGMDCSSNPCSVYSDCLDHGAGYQCVCYPGYKGVNCNEVMEEAKELIEHIQANNTNMNVTVCRELHLCSFKGCGQQLFSTRPQSGCSCDDVCKQFGDCCWDYQSTCQTGGGNVGVGFGGHAGIGGYLDYDPFGGADEFDMPTSVDPSVFSCFAAKISKFLFVSRCPSDWNSSDSRTRCEGDADFSDPLTFVPVSLGTIVTFRNVYCAICHGVQPTNLISWSVDFDCGDDVILRSDLGEMLERFRKGICNHTIDNFYPIADTPAQRPCFQDMINKCPEDYADNAIIEACAGFRAPLQLQPPANQSTFFNGYCLECNLPAYKYSDFSPCATIDEVFVGPVAGFPLTVLVDFKGTDGIQFKVNRDIVRQETVECSDGAVFDSLAGTCRSLTCTDGYTLQDGECTWNVRCDGNHVGIKVKGLIVTDKECVSPQERQFLMECLANILELSMDNVSLAHVNPMDHCISHDVNETMKMDVHVKMSYSKVNGILADTSRVHLCGASTLQFHVSCSDQDRFCHSGWISMDYGNDISVVSSNQTSYLTFRGLQATQRFQPANVRRMVEFQRQQMNGTVSFQEMVQFCSDLENSTIPRLGDPPCPMITMNASEFNRVHIGNKTIMGHKKSGRVFNESEFRISDTGSVLVCSFSSATSGIVNVTTSDEFMKYSDAQSILSTVCITLSLISISVTFSTHIMFPSLRRLTNNKLLMMLCFFLFVAQLLTVIGSYASPIPALCKFFSMTTHFCWIAVFALTNSLAFDLHQTFGYNRSFKFAQTSFKSLIRYLVYVPGVSLCVVIPCACIDHITDSMVLDYTYADLCWVGDNFARIMTFGVPMAVLLSVNVILFSYTALGIWKGHQNAKKVGRKNLRPSVQERFDLLKIYIKVSTLMGFSWTTAFIIPFSGIPALWFLFIVLNGLQGVYLFLAFTVNARVWNLCKALVSGVDESSASLSRRSTRVTETTSGTELNNQGKGEDDLTVDIATVRRWKDEQESMKKLVQK